MADGCVREMHSINRTVVIKQQSVTCVTKIMVFLFLNEFQVGIKWHECDARGQVFWREPLTLTQIFLSSNNGSKKKLYLKNMSQYYYSYLTKILHHMQFNCAAFKLQYYITSINNIQCIKCSILHEISKVGIEVKTLFS